MQISTRKSLVSQVYWCLNKGESDAGISQYPFVESDVSGVNSGYNKDLTNHPHTRYMRHR
jgi:hypothetical protein